MKKLILLPLLALVFGTANANTTTPVNPVISAEAQVKAKYQGVVIRGTEREDGQIKVEIIHQQKEKDVVFNAQGVWQSTTYDMRNSELPDSIKQVLKNSEYSSWSVDDVEVIETPTQSMYEIELDKWFNDEDMTIYITFDGKIL